MIKHIVMWKLKEENKAANAAEIKARLEALVGIVDGLLSASVQINSGGADNYDAVLISEFTSFDALEKYKVFPEHVKISEFVKSARVSRACVDFEY